MSSTIAMALLVASQTFNLPPGLLSSICYVESKHVVSVLHENDGGSASYGLCQIKEATARGLGFKGPVELLYNPKINAFYAAKHFKHLLLRYPHSLYCAVSAYNAGSCRVYKTGKALNHQYIGKVMQAWADGK